MRDKTWGKMRRAGLVPLLGLGLILGGVAAPASAVLDDDGDPFAYMHDIYVREGQPAVVPIELSEPMVDDEEGGTTSVEVRLTPNNTLSSAKRNVDYTMAATSQTDTITSDDTTTVVNGVSTDSDTGVIVIPTTADSIGEGTERIIMSVGGTANGSADSTVNINILDDDAPVSVTVEDGWIHEGDVDKNMRFNVRLSKKPVAGQTVVATLYTGSGSSTAGKASSADFTRISSLSSTKITFTSADGLVKPLFVNIKGDNTKEPTESFPVYLASVSGGVKADGQATGHILNDDGGTGAFPIPRVYVGDTAIAEDSAGTVSIPVRVSPTPTRAVSLKLYTANGSATLQDYTQVKSINAIPVSFAAGQSSKTVSVAPAAVLADARHEAEESFSIVAGSVAGAAYGDKTGTVRILEEEGRLSVNVWEAEGTEGGAVGFKVTVYPTPSSSPAESVTFKPVTREFTSSPSDNALDPEDFTGLTTAGATRTLNNATTSLTINVGAETDALSEDVERFELALQSLLGGFASDSAATGRILNLATLPTVTAAADPASVAEGTSVGPFTATFSDDGDEGPWDCVVQWGDDESDFTQLDIATESSCNAGSHTYVDEGEGTYTVSWFITDNVGETGTDTNTVTVTNALPAVTSPIVPTAGASTDGNVTRPVTVTGSFTDAGVDDTHTVTVDWDGAGGAAAEAAIVDDAANTYTASENLTVGQLYDDITVVATDNDGGVSSGVEADDFTP